MSKPDKLDSSYTYWQYKKSKDIVRARLLRNYALVQLINIPSDDLFYLLLTTFSVDHFDFGWYKIHKSVFYKYFKPVPKLKEIILREKFGI